MEAKALPKSPMGLGHPWKTSVETACGAAEVPRMPRAERVTWPKCGSEVVSFTEAYCISSSSIHIAGISPGLTRFCSGHKRAWQFMLQGWPQAQEVLQADVQLKGQGALPE